MKKLALLLLCLPTLAMAQTETKKVIQMSVVRTVGVPVNTYLMEDEGFVGPMYNRDTKNLSLTSTTGSAFTVARTRLKEIRFSIEEIEVPTAIENIEADNNTTEALQQPIYDLSGRRISTDEALTRGIYIKGGKKFIINK